MFIHAKISAFKNSPFEAGIFTSPVLYDKKWEIVSKTMQPF